MSDRGPLENDHQCETFLRWALDAMAGVQQAHESVHQSMWSSVPDLDSACKLVVAVAQGVGPTMSKLADANLHTQVTIHRHPEAGFFVTLTISSRVYP